MSQKYFWAKSTGTHADALGAAGLAKLLQSIGAPPSPRRVQIVDDGACYCLDVTPDVTGDDVDRWQGDPFFPYISGVLKNDANPPPGAIDYQEESARLIEARKAKPRGRKLKASITISPEDEALSSAAREPHKEIAFLRVFRGMRKGFYGDLYINRAILADPPRKEVFARLERLRSNTLLVAPEPPPMEVKLSASQWFLPLAGKGVSRVKAHGASPGQYPAKLIDWFESWMRFIGMYQAMTSHPVGDDLVLCVLAPGPNQGIPISALSGNVRSDLRDRRVGGSNVDVRVILETCRALIRHSREYAQDDRAFAFGRRRASDLLSGIHATTYKKMGTASSVMNVAFLGLPRWIEIRTHGDALAFDAIIENLDDFQRQFVNSKGKLEDPDTIRLMREFLSHGTREVTLAFLARASVAVMARLTAKKFTQFLLVGTIRRVIMAEEDDGTVARIVDDAGFQNVARAIRAATIHAMLYAETRDIEPFYGLAQTWKQHAADQSRMAALLSEFVQRFNGAIARKREAAKKRGGPQPKLGMITEQDLMAVLQLMISPGSSSTLVTHLLLGFGYAQVKKKDDTNATGEG